MLERLTHPFWVLDVDAMRVVWANPPALAFLGVATVGDLASDRDPQIARYVQAMRNDFEMAHRASQVGMHTFRNQGEATTGRISLSGIRLDDGRVGILHELLDLTASSNIADKESLRATAALLYTSLMISLYTDAGPPLYRNPAAAERISSDYGSLAGRFVDLADHAALMAQVASAEEGRIVARVRTPAGERWHDVIARRCGDALTGGRALLISETDVSELKHAEAQATHLAFHDHLTGLPNRAYVARTFDDRLGQLRLTDSEAAMIFVDVDRFKQVNDTFGHSAGDELLVEFARRLRASVRGDDLVARLGGDEFLVLASAPDILAHVTAITGRLVEAVSEPLCVDTAELVITTSIGVSLFPRDGADLDTLLRHADLAMYEAKDRGRSQIRFFSPELEPRHNQLLIESELRRALRMHEFEVYYQPRVATADARICGAEALVRWNHPSRGLVMPDDFVPACEEIGLIGELGREVLRLVVCQQVLWRALGHHVKVSVNLSPKELRAPDLSTSVAELVRLHGGDPTAIEFEITESVLLGDQPTTARALDAMRAAGFRIAVDDFGTGYSNLAYLHRYPIDSLKIDRLFVQASERGLAIAATVLAICKILEVTPVAEGVETPAQLAWLVEHGCGEYQGFLYSPAVPACAFLALVDGQRAQA